MLRIVTDSREQDPFHFAGYDAEVVPGTLQAGDYSLVGLEDMVAVERKSLPDLVACLGRERATFSFLRHYWRTVERRYRAVVGRNLNN